MIMGSLEFLFLVVECGGRGMGGILPNCPYIAPKRVISRDQQQNQNVGIVFVFVYVVCVSLFVTVALVLVAIPFVFRI